MPETITAVTFPRSQHCRVDGFRGTVLVYKSTARRPAGPVAGAAQSTPSGRTGETTVLMRTGRLL
jgi:hypothetical protein